jgi:hypothetical protein
MSDSRLPQTPPPFRETPPSQHPARGRRSTLIHHRVVSAFVVLSLAAALLGACASLPPARTVACPPPDSAANPKSLPDLAGTYRLVMVESTPKNRTTQGLLSLAKRPSPQPAKGLFGSDIDLAAVQPFYGTSTIALDSVGAMTEGTLSSTDPHAPGAAITRGSEHGQPTVALGLGSVRNDMRTFMNDGSITLMRIERIGPHGFSGRWRASVGYSTYRAAGSFCAVRIGTPVPARTDPSGSHVQTG